MAGEDITTGGRTFPPPSSISPEAQAALAQPTRPPAPFPAPDDHAAWLAHIATTDAALAGLWDGVPDAGIDCTAGTLADAAIVTATPRQPAFPPGKVYLDMHGGALVYLGGPLVAPWARYMAARTGVTIVSVDYRMPPVHPYPAGLDDCLGVYRALLDTHGAPNIVVGGSSAGGNLAAALVLRARDEGLALPAGLVLLSPEADLTESGDTFRTLDGVDRMRSLMPINRLYAAGAPLDDPCLSPLFGDFTKGFPPTFLQSGTRDLFLSTAVRMHRALREADVPAELHVWEAMPHGGFMGSPEDRSVNVELRKFLGARWS